MEIKNVFDELVARGLIAQTTHEDKIKELLEKEQVTFYVGFDPTADSLHVGHYVPIIAMAHLQRAGHRPIALFGSGTGMIGDPSGKSEMRQMLTKESILHNIGCFKSQMSRLIDFSEDKALMEMNGDWLLNLNYIEFLREVGIHFSVNRMLAAECYKQRLEKGLSFFELNYMIMQSYDFLVLFKKHGCKLQMGGDDQWSNIIYGVDLIRRTEGEEAYGMTFSLLQTSDGRKMGKTEKGAVWLDAEKTSPYDFFQYWRNVDDADVIRCLKMLTFVSLEEIAEFEKYEGSALNSVKERLAFEVTKLIHGEEEAVRARDAAKALFVGNVTAEDMPSTVISADKFADGALPVLDLLTECGLIASKSEGRRLIEQGGINIDEQKIGDVYAAVPIEQFDKGYVVIKKGKKIYHKAALQK